MPLTKHGGAAGRGDIIQARRNDTRLGVVNRGRYEVLDHTETGGLRVRPVDGADTDTRELPAGYVRRHVALAYAGTVHASQGTTLDTCHAVVDGREDPAGLYVAMTRGRHRNTAHVATTRQDPEKAAPGLDSGKERPSALAVLADILARETSTRDAALTTLERDQQRAQSAARVLADLETVTGLACRARLDRHLDQLARDGRLDQAARARLCVDDATERLARLLRSVELDGRDPLDALEAAVLAGGDGGGLTGTASPAAVLCHRIRHEIAVPGTAPHRVPSGVDADVAAYVSARWEQLDQRRRDLGSHAAEDVPSWATSVLGPVPTDPTERLEWEHRAGTIAVYREATGFDHRTRPLGRRPSMHDTERRALWAQAWEALGRPDNTRAEAELTDGQLRLRVAAWEREKAWAPAYVAPAMRETELTVQQQHQDSVLAGRNDQDDHRDGEAAVTADLAERLDTVHQVRARWVAATAHLAEQAEQARAELERRGITLGDEPDKTTAVDWLELEHAARAEDDQARPITADDVHDPDTAATGDHIAAIEAEADDLAAQPLAILGAETIIDTPPRSTELDALTTGVIVAAHRLADHASLDAHEPATDPLAEAAADDWQPTTQSTEHTAGLDAL